MRLTTKLLSAIWTVLFLSGQAQAQPIAQVSETLVVTPVAHPQLDSGANRASCPHDLAYLPVDGDLGAVGFAKLSEIESADGVRIYRRLPGGACLADMSTHSATDAGEPQTGLLF